MCVSTYRLWAFNFFGLSVLGEGNFFFGKAAEDARNVLTFSVNILIVVLFNIS